MTPVEKLSEPVPGRNSEFWSAYPEIAWSNRHASDTVCIRAALMRPRFECLLAIARQFGLEQLRAEWEILVDDELTDSDRAAPHVERSLRNIEIGFNNARA